MTEEEVREMFFKHYFEGPSGGQGSLNEALRETSEEVALILLTKHTKPGETLPEIIRTIIGGKSRVGFFMAMFAAGIENPTGPMTLIFHFDHIRKAMLDAVNYMHDNYEAADQFFKERFPKEDLKMMSADMAEAIEKPSGLPANMRGIRYDELKKEDEFFSFALVGILGMERFQKYAEEYNKCAAVLRQCQAECKMIRDKHPIKES